MAAKFTRKTYHETGLSAAANVKLFIARYVDKTKCYCLGYDRQDKRAVNFDGYYFINELKKI